MKKIIYLLVLSMCFCLTHAQTLLPSPMQIEIKPLKLDKLKVGDVFNAEINLGNEKSTNEIVDALNGARLFDGLILNNLFLTNDQKIHGDVFIQTNKLKDMDVLKIDTTEFTLVLKMQKIEAYTTESREFAILEQSSSHWNWLLILGIIALVIAIAIIKRKNIYNLFVDKKKKNQKEKKAYYLDLMKSAQSRKEFEAIYLSYEDWSRVISHDAKQWDKFKKVLNAYQFKPVWENSQFDEVRQSYSVFKGSLK